MMKISWAMLLSLFLNSNILAQPITSRLVGKAGEGRSGDSVLSIEEKNFSLGPGAKSLSFFNPLADLLGEIEVWDLEDSQRGGYLYDKSFAALGRRHVLANDGKTILAEDCNQDGVLITIDVENGEVIKEYIFSNAESDKDIELIFDFAFAGSSEDVLALGKRGTIKVWRKGKDKPSIHELPIFNKKNDNNENIIFHKFSNDGQFIIAISDDDYRNSFNIWNINSGKKEFSLITEYENYGNKKKNITVAAFSPDNKKLLVGYDSPDANAQVWSWKDLQKNGRLSSEQKPLFELNARGRNIIDARFSLANDLILTSEMNGYDGYAVIWDAFNGKELAKIKPGPFERMAAQFDPSGKFVATLGPQEDCFIEVWQLFPGGDPRQQMHLILPPKKMSPRFL